MSHLVKALWDELWFVNMGYTNKIWLIDDWLMITKEPLNQFPWSFVDGWSVFQRMKWKTGPVISFCCSLVRGKRSLTGMQTMVKGWGLRKWVWTCVFRFSVIEFKGTVRRERVCWFESPSGRLGNFTSHLQRSTQTQVCGRLYNKYFPPVVMRRCHSQSDSHQLFSATLLPQKKTTCPDLQCGLTVHVTSPEHLNFQCAYGDTSSDVWPAEHEDWDVWIAQSPLLFLPVSRGRAEEAHDLRPSKSWHICSIYQRRSGSSRPCVIYHGADEDEVRLGISNGEIASAPSVFTSQLVLPGGETSTVSGCLRPPLVKKVREPTGTFPLAAFPGKHDASLDQTSSEYLTFPQPAPALCWCFHFPCCVCVCVCRSGLERASVWGVRSTRLRAAAASWETGGAADWRTETKVKQASREKWHESERVRWIQ